MSSKKDQQKLIHSIINFKYKNYNTAKIQVSKNILRVYPMWYDVEDECKEFILQKLNNIVQKNEFHNLKSIIHNEISYSLMNESLKLC